LIIAVGVETMIAQTAPKGVLFENVRIFDGQSLTLSAPSSVLVRGNRIQLISPNATPVSDPSVTVVDGGGRTLMPGLIDVHTHLMYSIIPQFVALFADVGYINIVATNAARDMLLRGFTSVRDMGGPTFGLKLGIDQGLALGPRIWPAGAMISQSGGHGDFRPPNVLPAEPDYFDYIMQSGGSIIADGVDEVLQRSREQLALGGSQVKVMAGGGVTSNFDPLDVVEYTLPEIQAAVSAAQNWGTYVTVHAYTPPAVRQAIDAGVLCIEHGQLLDADTVALMAQKGIWWSLQAFSADDPSPFPDGSDDRAKELVIIAGTDNAYKLARQYQTKTAWGTDNLSMANYRFCLNARVLTC
jgi:imidazolonepropionase-like amidohydrolase